MLRFFQQPYPFGGNLRKKMLQNVLIGGFVAFFLLAFQPFGTANWHSPYKVWYLLGYGLVSFLGPALVHLALFSLKNTEQLEKEWTIGRDLLLHLLIMTTIALANMLYGKAIGISSISLPSLMAWLSIVVLVGVFPLTAGILVRYNQYLALNQRTAAAMEADLQHFRQENAASAHPVSDQLTFTAENEKDRLLLAAADLLYIESADNYANFVFYKNGKVQKVLLRGPLKRFEDQIGDAPDIVRCHRSFIVNLAQVEHIRGNAQGYQLSFQQSKDLVPVARNYGPAVLKKMGS